MVKERLKNRLKQKRINGARRTDVRSLVVSNKKAVVYSTYVLLVALIGYHFIYAHRIIPGVYIGAVDVGGMKYKEAYAALENYTNDLDTSLTLTHDDMIFDLSGEALNLVYKPEASVVRAFEVGRTGNLFADTKDKLAGLVKPLKVRAFYDINDIELSDTMALIKGELNRFPQNAYYFLIQKDASSDSADVVLKIGASKDGIKADSTLLHEQIVSSFDFMEFGQKDLAVVTVTPKVTSEHLQKFQSQVEQVVLREIKLFYEGQEWSLYPEDLLKFVAVKFENSGSSNVSEDTQLGLNTPAFESFVEVLSQEVNKLPRGQVTRVENNKVTGFELIQDGVELDVKKFTDSFKAELFEDLPQDNIAGVSSVAGLEDFGVSELELDVNVLSGPEDPEKYGIFTLLGEGNSRFTGSGAPRVHNLTLAAERTNGVLVPPGEIYSFNNAIGNISGASGYMAGYIISGGKTVLGDGGGVCQTSTTIFRAILDAGLPILTRHPHAYRVLYYELDTVPGFDASVYQPALDFQFKNDTPNHILVQSSWDKDASTLKFSLYGTPDGREVTISEPTLSNQIAPPVPRYQNDSTLAKGIVKQVDWAAWGGTASFDRVVKRGDEVLYEDTFTTVYQPWQAAYLVGTKE